MSRFSLVHQERDIILEYQPIQVEEMSSKKIISQSPEKFMDSENI